ncbi:hypothetical protein G6F56_007251 [Rhizopus delemar]|nr:hypothetical protein G6F56_007251 [Rhizopus delemar]
MSQAEENDNIARSVASLFTSRLEDREDEDLKEALAASLGKTVSQLTARDLLLGGSSSSSSSSNSNSNSGSGSGGGGGGIKRQASPPPAPTSVKRPDILFEKYWDGIVKLTYVQGFVGPRYLSLKEIVQKNDLKKAVITAFVYSMDYIDAHFPADVNIVLVTHGRPAMAAQVGEKRVIIQPPLKDGKYGVFHNKLMILFRSSSVRVVIGSANMIPWDYEEMENVVFIQDFPELTQPLKSEHELPKFAKDISDVLDKMRVPSSVKDELLKYDFSKAKARIVASVSGVFEGEEDFKKYGHTRLADIVRDITGPLEESNYPKVEMQIPSVDIVFPTRDTVSDSRCGPSGADTICLNTATWQKPTFPKQVMCDAISHRPGTLMHSKKIK